MGGLDPSAPEAGRGRNNKRGTRSVSNKKSVSRDTGRLVDDADEEVQAVSQGEEGELMDKAGKGKHRHLPCLTTMDPGELSGVVGGRRVEGVSRLWAAEEDGCEMSYPSQGVRGVKPYRNIENVFLPLPRDMEVVRKIAHYVTQGHGGRLEASASRLQPIDIQDNYLDAISDADEFKKDLIDKIEQMMYVSGETGEPSAETTGMIEEIVRQQVVEIVSTALKRRGDQSS